MTPYEQGFLNKCAECGLSPEDAGGMCAALHKLAYTSPEKAQQVGREVQNEMLERAYLLGLENDPRIRAYQERLRLGNPGSFKSSAKDWWLRLWSGGGRHSKYRAHLQSQADRVLDEAYADYAKTYAALPAEQRRAMQAVLAERRQAKAWAAMSPDMQAAVTEKMTKPQTPNPSAPVTPQPGVAYTWPTTVGEDTLRKWTNGELKWTPLEGHSVDPVTGEWHAIKGRDSAEAVRRNRQLQSKEPLVPAAAPAKPPQWTAPGPFTPPTVAG